MSRYPPVPSFSYTHSHSYYTRRRTAYVPSPLSRAQLMHPLPSEACTDLQLPPIPPPSPFSVPPTPSPIADLLPSEWFYITGPCVLVKAHNSFAAAVHFMTNLYIGVPYFVQQTTAGAIIYTKGNRMTHEVINTHSFDERLVSAPNQCMFSFTPTDVPDGTIITSNSPRPMTDWVFERSLWHLENCPDHIRDAWEIYINREALTDKQLASLDFFLSGPPSKVKSDAYRKLYNYRLGRINTMMEVRYPNMEELHKILLGLSGNVDYEEDFPPLKP